MVRINKSIESGEFFKNKSLLGAIKNCRKHYSKLHIIGLLQSEGVHAHENHLYALLDLCKKQKFKDLNSSIRRNIALEDIDDAEISPRRVVVEIPVSLFNEYTGFIPVSKQNVPDSLNLITFPGKIEVKCIVAFNNYGKLNPSSFIFSVDYQDIGKNGNTLPISVYRVPSHIKSLNFQPLEVEYIIEKK